MRQISRSEVLGVLAAGAATAALPQPVRAQTVPFKLRVGSVPADTYAEGYYALDLGLFDKAGLSVEIIPFTNGAAMAAAADPIRQLGCVTDADVDAAAG